MLSEMWGKYLEPRGGGDGLPQYLEPRGGGGDGSENDSLRLFFLYATIKVLIPTINFWIAERPKKQNFSSERT